METYGRKARAVKNAGKISGIQGRSVAGKKRFLAAFYFEITMFLRE